MKLFFATTVLFASMSAMAVSPNDIKQPESFGNAFVSDTANIISAAKEKELDQALSKYHEVTGVQVAVVTTKDTSGSDSPRTFANKVFELFELGDPKLDNGLLILLSVDDRRVEFETGYGIEGLLPDVTQYRIQQEYMIPSFKAGDYEQGLMDGTYATLVEIGKSAKAEAAYQSTIPNQAPPNTLSLLDRDNTGDDLPTLAQARTIGSNVFFILFGLAGFGVVTMILFSMSARMSKRAKIEELLKESESLVNSLTLKLDGKATVSNISKNPCDYCHETAVYTSDPYRMLLSSHARQDLHLSRYDQGLIAHDLASIVFIECAECKHVNKKIALKTNLSHCPSCSELSWYSLINQKILLTSFIHTYKDTIDRTLPLQGKLFKTVKLGWQANTHTIININRCFICGELATTVKQVSIATIPPKPKPMPKPKPALETRHVAAPSASPKKPSSSSSSSSSWGSSGSGFGLSSTSRSKPSSRPSSSPSSSSSRKSTSSSRSRGGKSGGGGAGSSW